ncbi:hypothetical protein [Photorhabdus laumondii]|uniref:hypothetical protein n=1 Tax=Photorhabdus laumondii TaxID=2218628 RepID=UPI0025AFEDE0|nr:hypothetical protein [Photorhabdus laumondii]
MLALSANEKGLRLTLNDSEKVLREEVVRRSTTGEHLTVQLEEVRSALKDSQEERGNCMNDDLKTGNYAGNASIF